MRHHPRFVCAGNVVADLTKETFGAEFLRDLRTSGFPHLRRVEVDPSKVQRVATAVADSLAGGKKDDTFMRVKTSVAVMHHGP